MLKGGRRKRSGGVFRAVYGVFNAETAEVGETEQCFGADHHGEVEPQLSEKLRIGRFEDIEKGGQGVFDQPKADPWSGPAGKVGLSDGRRDH